MGLQSAKLSSIAICKQLKLLLVPVCVLILVHSNQIGRNSCELLLVISDVLNFFRLWCLQEANLPDVVMWDLLHLLQAEHGLIDSSDQFSEDGTFEIRS